MHAHISVTWPLFKHSRPSWGFSSLLKTTSTVYYQLKRASALSLMMQVNSNCINFINYEFYCYAMVCRVKYSPEGYMCVQISLCWVYFSDIANNNTCLMVMDRWLTIKKNNNGRATTLKQHWWYTGEQLLVFSLIFSQYISHLCGFSHLHYQCNVSQL